MPAGNMLLLKDIEKVCQVLFLNISVFSIKEKNNKSFFYNYQVH
jgi:hypothetical protein